jgi:predicted alpha/beta hydrolase
MAQHPFDDACVCGAPAPALAFTGHLTVATGSGYWRENAWPLKRRAWWLWYIVAPLAVALYGHFPGRRLRKVGDLPKDVMVQWRRWCLHPEYAVGVEGDAVRAQYAAVRTPIVALSFPDDEFMSARNTESIHGFYIGHFGFFRTKFEQ